jgi:hypothetical protein
MEEACDLHTGTSSSSSSGRKRRRLPSPTRDEKADWHDSASGRFLSGELAATSTHDLISKAQKAAGQGCEDLAKAGKSGKLKKNIARDLRRTLRKKSHWPQFYWAQIPIWDAKTETSELKWHPFLLPHEWLLNFFAFGLTEKSMPNEALHSGILEHIRQTCLELGIDPEGVIPLGFHCDGVPFGSRVFTDDSLELFSMNFPCEDKGGLRVPFTALQRRHLAKHITYNAVLEVLKWSLNCLAMGVNPQCRHDGSPWRTSDKSRSKKGLQSPIKALLVEIRADWDALKQVFQFPQHNETAGICWKCKATPATFRDCSSQASWRSERLSPEDFHFGLQQSGYTPCPLFSAPGVSAKIVVVDWLHACDLGIAADIQGNVLNELLACMPGSNVKDRVSTLWQEIQKEYKLQGTKDRLESLTVLSFLQPKKAPKLRGKAAVIRALVPVLDCIVQRHMTARSTVHQQTVARVMGLLAKAYTCLDSFDEEVLDKTAKSLGLLVVALETEEAQGLGRKNWAVKPKLHLFMELATFICKERGNPRWFWVYADETNGGIMRCIGTRRGGKNSSSGTAFNMLSKWCCTNVGFTDKRG